MHLALSILGVLAAVGLLVACARWIGNRLSVRSADFPVVDPAAELRAKRAEAVRVAQERERRAREQQAHQREVDAALARLRERKPGSDDGLFI